MHNDKFSSVVAEAFEKLSDETAYDMIDTLVRMYMKRSVNATSHLLNLVSDISKAQIEHLSKMTVEANSALHWLMVQHELSPDPITSFSMMTPVCKVLFPTGKLEDGAAESIKKYYQRYLELFRQVFKWNDNFSTWASINGYTDYLKLVESSINERKDNND